MAEDDVFSRVADERRRKRRADMIANPDVEHQVPMVAGGEVRMFTVGAAFIGDDEEDAAEDN